MKFRQTDAPRIAAANASFSTAFAYHFEQDGRLPSHKVPIRDRRRPDPLAKIFDAEVVPKLEAAPALRAVAVLEELQRLHSELAGLTADAGATDPGMAGTAWCRSREDLPRGS